MKGILILMVAGLFSVGAVAQQDSTSIHHKEFKIEQPYPCALTVAGKVVTIDSLFPNLGAETDTITISELLNAGKVEFANCGNYQILSFEMIIHIPRPGKKAKDISTSGGNFSNEMIQDIQQLKADDGAWIDIQNISFKTSDNVLHFVNEKWGLCLIMYKY